MYFYMYHYTCVLRCFSCSVKNDVGMGDPRHFVMQTHFDNPTLSSTQFDSSGFRYRYTPTLRMYDAGTLMIGSAVGPKMIVPPQQVCTQLLAIFFHSFFLVYVRSR